MFSFRNSQSAIRNSVRLVAMLVACGLTPTTNAQEIAWSLRPYRVQALLAVAGPGQAADRLAATLPDYLAQRAAAAIGPLWQLETLRRGRRAPLPSAQ